MLSITSYSEARAARDALRRFLSSSLPAMDALPSREFRKELTAERLLFGRRNARISGKGYLENAIRHLKVGTAGTDDLVRSLEADVARIGDGTHLELVGDMRAHAEDGVAQLTSELSHVKPRIGKLAIVGAVAGVGALAWSLLHA